MEDKEEKYFIHKVWDETIIQGNKFTTFHNDYGVEFTRQKAIEVMAKGMNIRLTEKVKNNEKGEISFEFYAEAALNALLEGGKK